MSENLGFFVNYNYLKNVGVYVDHDDNGIGFAKIKTDSKNRICYKYPTLSCKLDFARVDNDVHNTGNFILSLSYFVSDDFSKQSVEFSLDDWNEFGLEYSGFETLKRSGFFDYFSITNTLINRVFQSRLNGRKAWKKRNFPLLLKNAKVIKEFGFVGNVGDVASGTCDIDVVDIMQQVLDLDKVMSNCIKKAASSYSYVPFDVYYDCAKKRKSLLGKVEKTKGVGVDTSARRLNRDTVFKQFVNEVKKIQGIATISSIGNTNAG